MLIQTRRLAMIMAMLWFGFGVGGPAEAALALLTPAGLSPGDSFRFVFVTSTARDATSPNIADYDAFVTQAATSAGLTYDGLPLTWHAIASTPTVNASDPTRIPTTSSTPIYRIDGVQVASSGSGLWSGTILAPIFIDEKGMNCGCDVWTGTTPSGRSASIGGISAALGGPGGAPQPVTGDTGRTDSAWITASSIPSINPRNFYAASDVILAVPAVPEPSTLLMAGTGISAGLAYGWIRHRREQRRQSPVGPPDATE